MTSSSRYLLTAAVPYANRLVHIGEPERIVEVIERGIQKAEGRLRVAEAAHAQEPRDRRMDIERRGQSGRLRVVTRKVLPEELSHARLTFKC